MPLLRRRWLLGGAIALLVLSNAAAAVVWRALTPLASDAPEVIFRVEPGQPLAAVTRNLEIEGLIRSSLATEWLARLRGLAGELRSGEYRLSPALRSGQILEKIAEGRVATWEVALPEGFNAVQIGERLAQTGLVDFDAWLAAVHDPTLATALGVEGGTLEGYLFPETYRLPRGLAAAQVAKVMVEQFHAVWQPIAPLAAERGLSMREVVTLASIIEKESGVPEERPLIASVFQNRLARRMRLESDPTVIYGIPDFDGNLRRRDLENTENPYNTYRISALPPGPIASPGAEALRAVVEPAESDYLYFVSRNNGTHIFSRTYREHVIAVNEFQRRRRVQ
jgi:UPF0755 protein